MILAVVAVDRIVIVTTAVVDADVDVFDVALLSISISSID